jgi:hypothetical protein
MYLTTVFLLMLGFPLVSIGVEYGYAHGAVALLPLVGKWFVFWSAGVRLVLAGLRQFFQPRFTSEQIFDIKSDEALPLVRELGVANFATGAVAIASLARPGFVLPVAISAGIFYGIAGIRHAAASHRTANETIAMVSDLFVFAVLALYVVLGGWTGGS